MISSVYAEKSKREAHQKISRWNKTYLHITLSENKIYGVSPNNTNDSTEFLSFINDLCHTKRDLYQASFENSIMICDNSSIHKTSKIRQNLKKLETLMLIIWPYMSWLNHAKKLIGMI